MVLNSRKMNHDDQSSKSKYKEKPSDQTLEIFESMSHLHYSYIKHIEIVEEQNKKIISSLKNGLGVLYILIVILIMCSL